MKIAVNVSAISYNNDLDFKEFESLGDVKFFGELTREELFELCADREALRTRCTAKFCRKNSKAKQRRADLLNG